MDTFHTMNFIENCPLKIVFIAENNEKELRNIEQKNLTVKPVSYKVMLLLVYTVIMIRLKKDSRDGGGEYHYDHKNFIDGFGSVDWSSPYWFGLKNMKKVTSQSIVDLVVHYTEGGVTKYDTFHNFVVKDDDYRMTYGHHSGSEHGGR